MTRVLLKTGKIASLILLGTFVVAGIASAAVTNCPGTANYDPNSTQGTQCYTRVALYAGGHTTKAVNTCTTWGVILINSLRFDVLNHNSFR